MEKILVIIGIIVICIIGFFNKLIYIYNLNKRHDFIIEYHNKFVDLINKKLSGNFDGETYGWLMRNVHKMHTELGSIGYVHYIDNLTGVKVTNHPLLLNFLPEIQQEDDIHNSIVAKRMLNTAKTCSDMFLRQEGDINTWKNNTIQKIKNPFSLFADGFRYVLFLPINCLYWLGFFSFNLIQKIKKNILVIIIEKIILLITLLSTVMTIVVGWEEFTNIVYTFFISIKK